MTVKLTSLRELPRLMGQTPKPERPPTPLKTNYSLRAALQRAGYAVDAPRHGAVTISQKETSK